MWRHGRVLIALIVCLHHFEVVKSTIQLYEAPGCGASSIALLLRFNSINGFPVCVLRFWALKSSKVLEVTSNLGGWFLVLPLILRHIQYANRFAPHISWLNSAGHVCRDAPDPCQEREIPDAEDADNAQRHLRTL